RGIRGSIRLPDPRHAAAPPLRGHLHRHLPSGLHPHHHGIQGPTNKQTNTKKKTDQQHKKCRTFLSPFSSSAAAAGDRQDVVSEGGGGAGREGGGAVPRGRLRPRLQGRSRRRAPVRRWRVSRTPGLRPRGVFVAVVVVVASVSFPNPFFFLL